MENSKENFETKKITRAQFLAGAGSGLLSLLFLGSGLNHMNLNAGVSDNIPAQDAKDKVVILGTTPSDKVGAIWIE